MTIEDIKDFIGERPGYLKKSASVLAERLEAPIEDCETALYEARKLARGESNDNVNDSVITEFQQYLNKVLYIHLLCCYFLSCWSEEQRFHSLYYKTRLCLNEGHNIHLPY